MIFHNQHLNFILVSLKIIQKLYMKIFMQVIELINIFIDGLLCIPFLTQAWKP